MPASLGGAVLTVTGLDNSPRRARHQDTLPPPGAPYSAPFDPEDVNPRDRVARHAPAAGVSHPPSHPLANEVLTRLPPAPRMPEYAD